MAIAQTYDRYVYSVYNTSWDDTRGRPYALEYTKTPTPVTAAWRQGLVDEALAYCPQDG